MKFLFVAEMKAFFFFVSKRGKEEEEEEKENICLIQGPVDVEPRYLTDIILVLAYIIS